jgi:thiamine-phosphate pyrophosphorylase
MTASQRIEPTSLRLIAITDSLRDGIDGLTSRAFAAVHGGATMVLVRLAEEPARTIAEVAHAIRVSVPHVPLIVSSRLDVALAVGATGVHLGVDDLTPDAVRRVVPPEFVIGASVGNDQEVDRAKVADFVGIGPIVGGATTSALGVEGFAALAARCGKPAVAIGGVDVNNVAAVMQCGASGIAVISALFASHDPAAAARALRHAQDASGR